MDNTGTFMILETLRHRIEGAYCEAQTSVLHSRADDWEKISAIVELDARKRTALNAAIAMMKKRDV
jgi:hypothetical protein